MVKYNKKLVFDYVWGNDIDGYDIDELEDDYEFMMLVIDYTRDKNMYSLCSDRVKSNFEFVKFVINKFKDDDLFICDIADSYLDEEREEVNRVELLIILCDLIDKESDYFLKYKIQLEGFYMGKLFNIQAWKKIGRKKFVDFVQFGFVLIMDEYEDSDIIKKYFAFRFIEDIVEEFNINLEKKVHSEFESFEELERFGVNKYLINLLFNYDACLSSYVSVHLDLLDGLKKKLDKINKRWSYYVLELERKRCLALIEVIHRYIEDNSDCYISESEMLYYIGMELGIIEKLRLYDSFDDKFCEDIMRCSDIEIAKKKGDFRQLRHYYNVKRMMINILKSDNLDGDLDMFMVEGNLKRDSSVLRLVYKANN